MNFSAGGGGKSHTRRVKLEEKNKKLAEERDSAAKEQKKQRGTSTKSVTTAKISDDLADVHPSRRAQVPRGV
jgi:nucleolar protein 6